MSEVLPKMPTYEYRCAKCGEHLEVYQSFSEEPLRRHAGCGGKLDKVFGSVGIVLKGSGFYRTDNRTSSRTKAEKADKSSSSDSSSDSSSGSSSDSSSGSSSKTETPTKPEKKTEKKTA